VYSHPVHELLTARARVLAFSVRSTRERTISITRKPSSPDVYRQRASSIQANEIDAAVTEAVRHQHDVSFL